MVRRGSKRLTSRETASESSTQVKAETWKSDGGSSRRLRGQSPGAPERNRTGEDRSRQVRRRKSRRSTNRDTDNGSSDDTTHYDDDYEDDNDDNDNDIYRPPSFPRLPVPSTWTTSSGKFDPKRSGLDFDATSTMAINVNPSHESGESIKSGVTEDSPSNVSHDTKTKTNTKSKTKSKSKKRLTIENDAEPLEGEIDDPVERHRFYKTLKKAGIKKRITIDESWDDSSACSHVSELSTGNASYILDLAQQKETRKKVRDEEALEEALELYTTWLTEGKSDDKNIFLMILNEVKKEQKAKYKKADKHQAALLDAALNEELKRREKLKEEREKEKEQDQAQNEEQATMPLPDDSQALSSGVRSVNTRNSSQRKESDTKISQIIQQTTSKRDLDTSSSHSKEEKENKDGSQSSDETVQVLDVIDIAERCTGFGPEVETPRSFNTKNKRSAIFSCFGSNLDDVMDPSKPRSKEDYPAPVPTPAQVQLEKEDSSRMFSRLRRQLSEKQVEQRKEEEKSWKKNNQIKTKEEKWWKKINDAKNQSSLFLQDPLTLDLTMTSAPVSPAGADDRLTKTDPGLRRKDFLKNNSSTVGKSSKDENINVTAANACNKPPTVEENMKKLSSPKKKKNTKITPDLGHTEIPKVKKKKKKSEKKSNDVGKETTEAFDIDEEMSIKKKKKKKDKIIVSEEDSTDFNDQKSAANPQSIITKKKKSKSTKEGSKHNRTIVFDESDSKSVRSSKGKKKKSKDSSGKSSDVDESSTKKKSSKALKDASLVKSSKKKKKRVLSDSGSRSEDVCLGDIASLDWANRSILKTESDTTNGSQTVIMMESPLR